jgi:hypothetical protein
VTIRVQNQNFLGLLNQSKSICDFEHLVCKNSKSIPVILGHRLELECLPCFIDAGCQLCSHTLKLLERQILEVFLEVIEAFIGSFYKLSK